MDWSSWDNGLHRASEFLVDGSNPWLAILFLQALPDLQSVLHDVVLLS